MKVKDLLKALGYMNPNDDVVLRHLYTNPEVVMTQIRAYHSKGRVVIDGYNREKNEGR